MAIKKSELYSSLWSSCDELRGGMDASQYKDYVLVLLFVKYVSDKYAGQPYAEITVPEGASFQDMVALKGHKEIGDRLNKQIIQPLAEANELSSMPDFNDEAKLGKGKEMVDRLTKLIAIFEGLDFSRNRADGDDILGDAYEYLMRHFATESGKSKGQFYTPAEVSRVIAQILGIGEAQTTPQTTVYDPTCGSGSLLLKIADAATTPVTLEGQEKDSATSGLARMNMILHQYPTAKIVQGNTLTAPYFTKDDRTLKTYDYVVANPPFSDKRWSTGLNPEQDPFERFKTFGIPPAKQGDYAYLLHIVRSLKSMGKGACILPHGVLFRGNAEAEIRRNLIQRGYIQGIIGLPANLFYGTGIPACIVVLDKEGSETREGIFMMDASAGFMKDGNKNRLRDRDIHRIVDVFKRQLEVPKFSRFVLRSEIEANEFNLNIPRYIDSQAEEDIQDIAGHLEGGIPDRDLASLAAYWQICPSLKSALFEPLRSGYSQLVVESSQIKATIAGQGDFVAFMDSMTARFEVWRGQWIGRLKGLELGFKPKPLVGEMGESLLACYEGQPLIDAYGIYQHLLDYWGEVMQDDCYLIADEGWKAETRRLIERKEGKEGKVTEKDRGWVCDLIPKGLLVARFFASEQGAIAQLVADLEGVTAERTELEEEHSGEEGFFADFDKINKASVAARLKEIKADRLAKEEREVLTVWQMLFNKEADLKRSIKEKGEVLDRLAYEKYPQLSVAEVQALVVEDKWMAKLQEAIAGEVDRISQGLTQRVKVLAERYAQPLPLLGDRVKLLEDKVAKHLEKMGFSVS